MSNEQEKDVSVIKRTPDDINELNDLREKIINLSQETKESIKRNIISCKEFNDSTSVDLLYMRKPKTSNLLDVVEKHKFIVLLGDAGEGKSIFLKSTAYEIMSNHDLGNNYLALYYSLNMYSDEDIQILLEKEYGDFSKFKDLKLLFLFDEFDQVQNKALLIKKMQSFREKFCDSLFCIASRSNAYSNNFNNAELVQLLPFSLYNIERIAKGKLPLKYNAFLQDAKLLNYMEFIKNPFNLNIIIDYYKINNYIPKNKAEIIDKVIKNSINE
ncbi:NACHT domain-containing protein, partial [Bacillus thuringiensis]